MPNKKFRTTNSRVYLALKQLLGMTAQPTERMNYENQ